MTRQDILDEIKKSKGDWVSKNDIKFTVDEDDTVTANKDGFSAFLMIHGGDDMGKFYINNSKNLKDVNELLDFLNCLNDDVDAGVMIESRKIIEVEKIVEKEVIVKDETVDARLSGKIQAYEKLLMGNSIKIEHGDN